MRRKFGTKTVARHSYHADAEQVAFDIPLGNRVTGSSNKNPPLPLPNFEPVGAADTTWGNNKLVKIYRTNKSINL